MAKYVRLEVRAEVCGDDNFAPADFVFKFAEEMSSYAHIVYIPEMETPTFPTGFTIADIGGWTAGYDSLLIVRNTGNEMLTLSYYSDNGASLMLIGGGCTSIITDIDNSANPSIQGRNTGVKTTFEALLASK